MHINPALILAARSPQRGEFLVRLVTCLPKAFDRTAASVVISVPWACWGGKQQMKSKVDLANSPETVDGEGKEIHLLHFIKSEL